MAFRMFRVLGENSTKMHPLLEDNYGEHVFALPGIALEYTTRIYDANDGTVLAETHEDPTERNVKVSSLMVGGSEDAVAGIIKKLDLENMAREKK